MQHVAKSISGQTNRELKLAMKPRFWGGASAIHMATQGHQLETSSECQ